MPSSQQSQRGTNEWPMIRCLPSFIIAGCQKSGTTALSAFLASLQSSISFAYKKEVHHFDQPKGKVGDMVKYLNAFPPWSYYNASTSSDSNPNMIDIQRNQHGVVLPPPLFGEASPAYIAIRKSCQLIGDMIPNIKLIILLREPASRAYSEYQMKKRRVEQQNEFISLALANQVRIHECLTDSSYATLAMVKACFPKDISTHHQFLKFIKMFESAVLAVHQNLTPSQRSSTEYVDNLGINRAGLLYKRNMKKCFSDTEEDTEEAIKHLNAAKKGKVGRSHRKTSNPGGDSNGARGIPPPGRRELLIQGQSNSSSTTPLDRDAMRNVSSLLR